MVLNLHRKDASRTVHIVGTLTNDGAYGLAEVIKSGYFARFNKFRS